MSHAVILTKNKSDNKLFIAVLYNFAVKIMRTQPQTEKRRSLSSCITKRTITGFVILDNANSTLCSGHIVKSTEDALLSPFPVDIALLNRTFQNSFNAIRQPPELVYSGHIY